MQNVLRTESLVKKYKDREVVKKVSITVSSGEVVGLLGPNGAGKTTTFYMMVGLVPANEGSVYLNDDDITNLPMYKRARKGISYLPQEASVFRKLTVQENIDAILETLDISKGEKRERLNDILRELNITHLKDSKAYSLSGGERRRVEISRSLVTTPKFILLDEPFAGIDPIAVADIQGIIKKLKEKNIGVVVSDHNVRETLGVCDRAYILNEGVILEEGTPKVIAESEKARKIYLGENFAL